MYVIERVRKEAKKERREKIFDLKIHFFLDIFTWLSRASGRGFMRLPVTLFITQAFIALSTAAKRQSNGNLL